MSVVRLKQPWKIWPIGHVFPDMAANQARALIARGVAEEVAETGVKSAFRSPVDRAMRGSQMTLRAKR